MSAAETGTGQRHRRHGQHRRHRRAWIAVVAMGVLASGLVGPVAGVQQPTGVLTACAPGSGVDTENVRIHEIQGTTRVSALAGEQVTDVPGVVTAKRSFGSSRGFWFQDPHGDDDPRTSEAVFVFTGSSTPDVEPGDDVRVSGTVQEYYPEGDEEGPNPATTELTEAEWEVQSSSNVLPDAEMIKPDTLPDELAPSPGGNIEDLELEPDSYALDFWASRESMRVAVEDVRVVGPTTEYDELYVTTKPEQYASPRGGTVYTGYDADNTGVVKVQSLIPFSERPFPEVDTGDTLAGVTAGPLTYDPFGGYTLRATELGEAESGGLERETASEQSAGELAVASYNVQNLSGVDPQSAFVDLARGMVDNLASPDIVTLAEVQDNTGPDGEGDGVTEADVTLDRITAAIEDAGGPSYEWRQISPQEGADGGQPGGNIRVALLFNPDRVSFADRPGGDATTPVEVEASAGEAQLSISPGRIAPNDQAWQESRKPLVGEFAFRGETVFVVGNHFRSKGSDQPIHGRYQPPERISEEQRTAQAESVRGFVDELLAVDPEANVVVAGDLNDYEFSPALSPLTGGDTLRSLMETLPQNERYTYLFEGRSQALDQMLISQAPREVAFEVVHFNVEFADQVSDHDPTLVRFRPGSR